MANKPTNPNKQPDVKREAGAEAPRGIIKKEAGTENPKARNVLKPPHSVDTLMGVERERR